MPTKSILISRHKDFTNRLLHFLEQSETKGTKSNTAVDFSFFVLRLTRHVANSICSYASYCKGNQLPHFRTSTDHLEGSGKNRFHLQSMAGLAGLLSEVLAPVKGRILDLMDHWSNPVGQILQVLGPRSQDLDSHWWTFTHMHSPTEVNKKHSPTWKSSYLPDSKCGSCTCSYQCGSHSRRVCKIGIFEIAVSAETCLHCGVLMMPTHQLRV